MQPDFLCIGAQKAATDWLYRNLARHPQVQMPPIKEIHYFDRPALPLIEPFWTNMACIKGARRKLAVELLRLRWLADAGTARWAWHFLFVTRSDDWYRDLFDSGPGRITGDITPAYARLDATGVAHVHRVLPQAKIIYILRNPMRRTWSQAVMYFKKIKLTKARDLRDVSDEQIIASFARPTVVRNSAYTETLDLWSARYPASNMFVGFYDDIVEDPREFLRSCFGFLEIDTSEPSVSPAAETRYNAGSLNRMPRRFHRYLSELYHAELCRLHERFGNRHTQAWLAECERSRAQGQEVPDDFV
jgi:hypothetical protein